MKEALDIEIQQHMDKLKAFDKMYDLIRYVDPVAKTVIMAQDGQIWETEERCFNTWQKEKICDNCISLRAYHDNQTYIKIEYNPQNIFMVTAVPIVLQERRLVLELMKDATNSMMLEDGENHDSIEVFTLIDQLNNSALKDGLTEVYNRRYIKEKLPAQISEAAAKDQDLSLVMCDLDHFKRINDTYGHLAGDQVLKRFSQILEGCVRSKRDWVARYGGEEFLVCLPDAGIEEAAHVAERMRQALEENEFHFSDQLVHITASFGVAGMKELKNVSPDSLIERADGKLYKAKQSGRNKVEI